MPLQPGLLSPCLPPHLLASIVFKSPKPPCLPSPAVHFEDQLSSEKKCGHLGGKVLVPTQQAIRNLVRAAFSTLFIMCIAGQLSWGG